MVQGPKWMLCRALVTISLLLSISCVEGEGIGARESRIRSILRAPRPPLMDEIASSQREWTRVDYGGRHPFERELQTPRNLNEHQPIRIRFITEPLLARKGINAELDSKIDNLIHQVLPYIQESWSKHLSLFPAQAALPIAASSCFGFYDTEIPQAFLNSGVPNADVVILVSAQDYLTTGGGQTVNFCPQHTLARAKTCSLDQNDRPIVGYINFCISGDKLKNNEQILDTSLVGVHEVGHVLGMDSDLFLFFRDPVTGAPLTPRPFEQKQVACVDGTVRTNIFPAENTLKRGQTNSGLVFYDVVTPRVRTVVRNHFNCQSLAGARLENQPTSNTCSGNHWDERLAYTENLSTMFSGGGLGRASVLSPLSLALMEDTGWYSVDYRGSKLSPFGHGRGCGFVNGDCIVNDQVPDYGKDAFCDTPVYLENGQFVNNDLEIYCDPSHTKFALCDLFDSTSQPNPFGLDPTREDVRYFSDTALTTTSVQADYCPMPVIELGLDCTDPNSNPARKFYNGEVYGAGSRCVNAHIQPRVGNKVLLPACLTTVCDENLGKVVVAGQVCQHDGQILSFPSEGHFFECPRLATICPQFFCPAGCSGRGTCNYGAVPPRCNCFDPSDTSAECSLSTSSGDAPNTPQPPPVTPMPTPSPTVPPVTPMPTPSPTVLPVTPPPTPSPTMANATPSPTPLSTTIPTPRPTTLPIPPIPPISTQPSTPSPTLVQNQPSEPAPSGGAMPPTPSPTMPPTTLEPTPLPTPLPTAPPTTTPPTQNPTSLLIITEKPTVQGGTTAGLLGGGNQNSGNSSPGTVTSSSRRLSLALGVMLVLLL